MKNISYRKKPTKTKEIKYITKQINDLNRQIHLTERLKQESQNKYEKQSFKITETKVKLEKELDSILKTLNEKENKIYNIQKLNLENFKKEISKYTKILEELERKKIEINIDISTIEKNISDLTQKIYKMKKSYKNNVKNSENLKEEAENILKELHELENKYPDEFNYLRENIQFQNSIIQLNKKNKQINKIIKEKKNKIKEDTSFKPVKIADTIYKELCKKKNYFINKLKEKKNKLSGYIIDSRNQKALNKSNSEGAKNLVFTNYLDRKVYKNIPITFPIYLSFKNEYESQSEKNRQEKIVEKFIQLKTHIHNQPENENLYLKEFLCKNGFDEPENHTPRKLINLSYFLNHPFNFDSKKRIKDIIKDALNYKPTNDELISDQNKLKAINYFTNGEKNKKNFISYSPQFYKKINAFPKTSIYKKENIFDSIDQEKFNNYLSLQKEKSHQSLSEIIINLEDEFTKMKNEKILVSDRTKINHEILKQKQNEENKLIPNLCLSYKGFSNLYLKRKKKENNKISNMIKKEEKINNINDRLYYSFKRKSEDMDKIRRRQKLTEYIFLERAKYKVLIDSKKKKIKNMPIID